MATDRGRLRREWRLCFTRQIGPLALAERQRVGREGMPQIVNAYVVQLGAITDVQSGGIDVGDATTRLRADDYPWILGHTRQLREHPPGGGGNRRRPHTHFGVAQPKLPDFHIHVFPVQRQDFSLVTPDQHQQMQCHHRSRDRSLYFLTNRQGLSPLGGRMNSLLSSQDRPLCANKG